MPHLHPARRESFPLAPSVTEDLICIGFRAIVWSAVTTYCDYPAEARKLPKIGGFMNPSLEAIVAKRPDSRDRRQAAPPTR